MVERNKLIQTRRSPSERAVSAIFEENTNRWESPNRKEVDPYMDAIAAVSESYKNVITGQFTNMGYGFRQPINPNIGQAPSDVDLREKLEKAVDQLVVEYIKRNGIPNLSSETNLDH